LDQQSTQNQYSQTRTTWLRKYLLSNIRCHLSRTCSYEQNQLVG